MTAPRMVYVMGSMGSGKSTFAAHLLHRLGLQELGPLTELHSGQNSRGSSIHLRGHHAEDLVYLGKMREGHPGQDGLDRATTVLVAPWLASGDAPARILTEGRLFLTERCFPEFADRTDLLVVHLSAEEWLLDLRFAMRGTSQTPSAVKTTVTLSERWSGWHESRGGATVHVDSGDPQQWSAALDAAVQHLS